MKKILLLLLLYIVSSFSTTYGQEIYNFSHFSQNEKGFYFSCLNQCLISIGEIQGNEKIDFYADIEGNGNIGYAFVQGDQIIPVETDRVSNGANKNIFYLKDLDYFSQIPKNTQVVFYFQGELKGQIKKIDFGILTRPELLKKWLYDFIQIETLTPYSINLRYGVNIGQLSIIQIGFIIGFFATLLILILTHDNKLKNIFFVFLIIFFCIAVRNLATNMFITYVGLNEYSFKPSGEKTFFDLGSYNDFVNQVRLELGLDGAPKNKSCNIYIDSYQDWPFKSHLESVYIKPCNVVNNQDDADYFIYYKKDIPDNTEGTIILDFQNSYLLKK